MGLGREHFFTSLPEAGQRAGCQSILVLTGYGTAVASRPEVAWVAKCPDLEGAAKAIIEQVFEI